MQLRFYGFLALSLFLALGYLMSLPPEPAAGTGPRSDIAAVTRADRTADLTLEAPASATPDQPVVQTVGLVGLLKDLRQRGATDRDIQTILHALSESGRLHMSALPLSVGQGYAVQDGDTLIGIAQGFYGTPAAALNLFAENRAVLLSVNAIPAGTLLRLP